MTEFVTYSDLFAFALVIIAVVALSLDRRK
jgi:hypothetical protein